TPRAGRRSAADRPPLRGRRTGVGDPRLRLLPDGAACRGGQGPGHGRRGQARARRVEPMIEPVRQGFALVEEIEGTIPSAGSLCVWWLGQSGYLIKSRRGLLAIDLYLSEHLTTKYQATNRPHIRMTRAPLRGGDLRGVDLVLASHKHSDHLDPGTLPDLLAASPRAVLVLPEAIREHGLVLGLPAERLVGLDAGGAIDPAG